MAKVKPYNGRTSYVQWLAERDLEKKNLHMSSGAKSIIENYEKRMSSLVCELEVTIDTSLPKTKFEKEMTKLKPAIQNPLIHLKVNFVNNSKVKQ